MENTRQSPTLRLNTISTVPNNILETQTSITAFCVCAYYRRPVVVRRIQTHAVRIAARADRGRQGCARPSSAARQLLPRRSHVCNLLERRATDCLVDRLSGQRQVHARHEGIQLETHAVQRIQRQRHADFGVGRLQRRPADNVRRDCRFHSRRFATGKRIIHSIPHSNAFVAFAGDKSEIRCRVVNRPFDIFGTWFCDRRLLSGDLNWLAHLVSTTVLWLNRANDADNAELVPEMRQLYQFRNRNASSIRALLVADAKWMAVEDMPVEEEEIMEPVSYRDSDGGSEEDALDFDGTLDNLQDYDIRQSAKFRREFGVAQSEGPVGEPMEDSDANRAEMDDLKLRCPKYLIFLTGFSTYSPHQVGFKFIDNATSVDALLRERQERNVSWSQMYRFF